MVFFSEYQSQLMIRLFLRPGLPAALKEITINILDCEKVVFEHFSMNIMP